MIKRRLLSVLSALALVLSLFTLLPEGALKASAADYYLYVGGVGVWLNDTVDDILGNGEASYDGKTRVLTLKKDITGSIRTSQSLTIVVENDVTVTNTGDALYISETTWIDESKGKLTLKSTNGYGINVNKGQLGISGVNLVIEGSKGGIVGNQGSTLIIDNSFIDCYGGVIGFSKINIFNCELLYPLGGKILSYYNGNYSNSQKIVNEDESLADHVAIGQNYDFTVADVRVNEYNRKDILGDGAASYDPDTNTLSLYKDINGRITDCIYEDEVVLNESLMEFMVYPVLKSGVDNLTINIVNNITISNPIDTGAPCLTSYMNVELMLAYNTKITGNGTLTLVGDKNDCCISLVQKDKTLTIDHANIIMKDCYYGIGSTNPFWYGSTQGGNLSVKYSYISISSKNKAIADFKTPIELDRCKVTTPSDATVGTTIIDNATNEEAKIVRISKTNQKYGLSVGGKDVNNSNCDDILGNGEAKYDYKSNKLYLYKDIEGMIYNIGVPDLTIIVVNPITVRNKTTGGSSIALLQNTSIITNRNLLTLNADMCGVLVNNGAKLKIADSRINAKADYPISGPTSHNKEALVINNSTINVEADEEAICDFTSITVTKSQLITPSDGIIKADAVYESNGVTKAKSVFLCAHLKLSYVSYVAASCEETGNIQYSHCEDCGKYFSDGNEITLADTVIPAKGHTPDDMVTENFVPPTDTTDASYDEVIYCKTCHKELSRVHKVINSDKKRQVGDLNGDGDITADDAIIAARFAAGYGDYSAKYDADIADMNRDGNVTADDAIIIARYAAGYGNYKELYTKYI